MKYPYITKFIIMLLYMATYIYGIWMYDLPPYQRMLGVFLFLILIMIPASNE